MSCTPTLIGLMSFTFLTTNAQVTNTFPNDGNIGVGTTSPDVKMHIVKDNVGVMSTYSDFVLESVDSQIDIISDSSGTWGSSVNFIEGNGSSNTNIWSIARQTTSGNGDSSLRFNFGNDNDHGNPNKVTFMSNGRVGIGNSAPAEKLDVTGNIAANTILLRDPITTSNWNDVWQSGFYQSYNATNAPETGQQWFWGVNLNHSANNSSNRYNGQIVIKNSSTNPTMYFRSTNKDGIGIWTKVLHGEGNQFINGNLGIGTTDPGTYKLAVKGKIRAEEIKVETGWADYVFKDDYDLPTLEEVEKHIQEKGHLPNIPSAREVEENGIHLGEMNKLLLEKIEELTLYTLKQEKRIQNLEHQILDFKNYLKQLKNED